MSDTMFYQHCDCNYAPMLNPGDKIVTGAGYWSWLSASTLQINPIDLIFSVLDWKEI